MLPPETCMEVQNLERLIISDHIPHPPESSPRAPMPTTFPPIDALPTTATSLPDPRLVQYDEVRDRCSLLRQRERYGLGPCARFRRHPHLNPPRLRTFAAYCRPTRLAAGKRSGQLRGGHWLGLSLSYHRCAPAGAREPAVGAWSAVDGTRAAAHGARRVHWWPRLPVCVPRRSPHHHTRHHH
jgi:hypothetical protein